MVMMSDAGIRDSPSRPLVKQQGMGFLMMHLDTRELRAAASFCGKTSEARRHQHLGTEGGAGSSEDDDGSTSRRSRTVHGNTSKRIHTIRVQDAQNQSGSVHAQLGGRQQMNASGPSAHRHAWVVHEEMPGHAAVPRMQHTPGTIEGDRVGSNTLGAVEHLVEKEDGAPGAG